VDLNHLNLRVRDADSCRDFYVQHFGFTPAFEAEGGYFLRNADGFLLAIVPSDPHQALPDGFHIGFSLESVDAVVSTHGSLTAAGVDATDVEHLAPDSDYVTFRCWDPDRTEIEIFWERS
jgi:catechol 2,3-dioxygenase-like lactoylglutathione lyase family enzyme